MVYILEKILPPGSSDSYLFKIDSKGGKYLLKCSIPLNYFKEKLVPLVKDYGLKTQFKDFYGNLSGLEYERKVYCITNEIIKRKHSFSLLKSFDMDEKSFLQFKKSLFLSIDFIDGIFNNSGIMRFLYTYLPNDTDWKGLVFDILMNLSGVLLEYIEGEQNLHTAIVEKSLDKQDFVFILFELLHTIAVMNKYSLQHNDLHTGNVLIKKLDKVRKVSYIVNGQTHKISTKFKAYIFDWDLSYSPRLGDNFKLVKMCKTVDICNDLYKAFDSSVLLCNIYQVKKDAEFVKLMTMIKFGYRLLDDVKAACVVSKKNLIKTGVLGPLEIMDDEYFV
jgi:hypothetical protein